MATTKMSLSSQVLSNTRSYLQINSKDSLPLKSVKTIGGLTVTLPVSLGAGVEAITSKTTQLISKPIVSEKTQNALAGRATDALSAMLNALSTLGGAWYIEPKRMEPETASKPESWSSTLWNHKGKIGFTLGFLALTGAVGLYAYQKGFFQNVGSTQHILSEEGKAALRNNMLLPFAGTLGIITPILCCYL